MLLFWGSRYLFQFLISSKVISSISLTTRIERKIKGSEINLEAVINYNEFRRLHSSCRYTGKKA